MNEKDLQRMAEQCRQESAEASVRLSKDSRIQTVTLRPTWDQTFMAMAHTIARRSLDPNYQCGAVIINDMYQVIGVGYNGPPRHPEGNDDKIDWTVRPKRKVIHAEQNALLNRVVNQHPKEPTRAYVTHEPCICCLIMLIQSGVVEIIYDIPIPELYENQERQEVLRDWSGVCKVRQML